MRKRNGVRAGILGLIVSAAICPGVALAADYEVDTVADGDDKECDVDCTLREAVSLASGTVDRVLLRSGNYVLTQGELSLNNDTIVGEDPRKTFIDGGDKTRVLRVIEVQSRVSGVTIRNGNGVGLDPDGVGGGIFVHSGSLILQNSTVSGNTGIMGAGIAASGIAALNGVTVSGNTASTGRLTRGGGIAADAGGGLILQNSTVSGNTAVDESGASSQGGGVFSSGALAIIASTIANNSAAQGGGLYAVAPETGTFSLQSSLIAHGIGSACGGSGIDNLSAVANVISDDSCQFKDPSNLQSVNPRIGELGANGGPTNTHALQPTSPALGHAASCLAVDQRGFDRAAPCDSGAYEYRAPTLRVVTQVVNDSGGSFNPSRFTVHVRTAAGGDVSGSPQPGDEKGTTYTLAPGAYAVSADGVAGYTLSMSGDCSVTLQEGQNRTCTITADDIAPTLRVVTNVVNDSGGTLGPGSFDAHVRSGGFDVGGSPQPGTASGTTYTLASGPTYTVSADAVAGYSLAITGACAANGNVTLQPAQTATCTITANDVAPTLRVITTVVNNSGGTATASNFSAHVRRNGAEVAGSPQAGAGAPGTLYTLTPGTYAVTADGVPGYAATGSGACNAAGSVTLALGQTVTCTITVDDIAPTLRVITTVSNNNGGTAVREDFDTHVRRNGAEVTGSPQAGAAAPGTLYTLTPGTYAVTADGVPGYAPEGSGACTTAGSVTLTLGQNLTCTITVDDITPTLRVITAVSNNSGGTAAAGSFSAHVRRNGAEVAGSPRTGVGAPGTLYTLTPGTYAVTADGVPGYAPTGSGACDAGGSVTLALGENATCTITVDDVAPKLTVVTNVVNDDGGTRAPGGFNVHVRTGAGDVGNSPAPGSGSGTEYTLLGGTTYTVAADAVSGYALAVSGACATDGTIALEVGQDRSCTITANDIAPTLTVITTVHNDNGGDLEAAEVLVHVRRGAADVQGSPKPGTGPPGAGYGVTAEDHVVVADVEDGYSVTYGQDCSPSGAITLALDQDATCTVTVQDGAATLNVETQVVNDDGGTATAGDFDVSVRRDQDEVASEPGSSATAFSLPGNATYTVSAGGVPGYTFAVDGDCAGDGSVTLPLSQARGCTVTANDVAPRLTVVTQVVNDQGGAAAPAAFTVHVRRGGADVAGSPKPGSASGTTYTLKAGAHLVSADAVSGYTGSISGACAGDGSITLAVGDSRTCTVTENDNPPATVLPSGNSQELPPPEPGKNVNALPKTGTVKVKLPGSAAYVDLDEAQQLPVGTVVDARKGHVTLVAAADASGGTATAEFWAGIFRLGQTKGRAPITVLTLVEKLSCPKAGRATIAARRKKKRRLWGDGNGRFQTKGKHSAATVVGTRWLVEDRCTSTLTRVVRGRVSVRDFAKKKTVTVRAGKKYVAKARKR